jgi:hypothetical protein
VIVYLTEFSRNSANQLVVHRDPRWISILDAHEGEPRKSVQAIVASPTEEGIPRIPFAGKVSDDIAGLEAEQEVAHSQLPFRRRLGRSRRGLVLAHSGTIDDTVAVRNVSEKKRARRRVRAYAPETPMG